VQNLCCVQERAVPVQRTVLTELAAADFRHPLDALATQQIDLIMRLTGMVTLVRRVIGPMAEQILEIENISTGVLVGPEQMPSLYALLTEACEILHIDVPDLYIRQNPIPNAYTLAINGQRPFIVLHSALLDMGLSAAELQTVIAHELGHLKCEHGIWITMANLLLLALGQLGELGRSLATVLGRRLFSWLQAAELSCDRAALLVMQDPRLVIGVLMKLSGGSATWASEMNPDAFLRQAVRLEAVSRTRLGRQVRQQMQRGATHPLPVVRARELDRWAHSVEYQRILARGRLAVAHSSERRPSLRREETLESSARNAN
jgi:Zn-dependent protease with chaperone function